MTNEWISVKERLPEEDLDVLIFCRPNPIAYPNGIQIGYFTGTWSTNDGSDAEVTHWMELPFLNKIIEACPGFEPAIFIVLPCCNLQAGLPYQSISKILIW